MQDKSKLDPETTRFLARAFSKKEEVALSTSLQAERKISRQAANSFLQRLVDKGWLIEGSGRRPKTYKQGLIHFSSKTFALKELEEHVVWEEYVRPYFSDIVNAESLNIWHYGVTEIVNNAIDHSEGSHITLWIRVFATFATIVIQDNGEGIFRRIARLCKLPDQRQAILELAKGKLTTDPIRHSGEGIFFSSRAFDRFQIISSGLFFDHGEEEQDILYELDTNDTGTRVIMRHFHEQNRTLKSIFDQFAAPDEYTFNKTVIPVRLAKMSNEGLMSRSQAQRLLARIDRFETVIFDFREVETIGQAFADEIFRVFQKTHSNIKIVDENTNSQIKAMISRAKSYI